MNQVYLLTGGNFGDRYSLLDRAKKIIVEKIGEIIKESSIYETAPWGFNSEQDFLNQVFNVSTDLSPKEILNKCFEIENELGRVRQSEQYSSRTIDVDILFYNDEIIHEQELIIPHEQLHKRRFTMEPLVEISPEYAHPKLNKTLSELLAECKDVSEVRKL